MRLKSITRRSEIARKLQIEQIVAPIAELLILLVLAGTILLPTNDKMVVEAQPNIGEISVQPLFDSTISSGKPSESDPGKDFLGIGFETIDDYQILQTYLMFSLEELPPGINIISASLRLELVGHTGPDYEMDVTVGHVLSAWEDNISWDSAQELKIDETNLVSTKVGISKREYEWNVTNMVIAELESQAADKIGFRLRGDESPMQHQRSFWASEDDSRPGPRLAIQYAPIPTVTPTLTPTPTPTPTPGLDYIHLRNNPRGELAGGDTVTYTITLQNGPTLLSNLIVTGTIPTALDVITDSITAPGGWIPSQTGNRINWRSADMAADNIVVLSYSAQRQTATPTNSPTVTPDPTPPDETATPDNPTMLTPTPEGSQTPTMTPNVTPTATPISSGLMIVKSGPISVTGGTDINYVLTITNSRDEARTGLTVTDYVPVGTEISDYGGGAATMPPSRAIQWQIPLIAPGDSVTRGYAVRTTTGITQVVNNLYFVEVIANGRLIERVVGSDAVVTSILSQPCLDCSRLDGSLQGALVSTPPAQSTEDDSRITHTPVEASWDGATEPMPSNPVHNPSYPVFLPSIPNSME